MAAGKERPGVELPFAQASAFMIRVFQARYGVWLLAAAVVAGCRASPVRDVPTGNGGATGAVSRAQHTNSWMRSEAQSGDILYVSSLATNDVYAYSYPGGKLEGTLTGFALPSGLCVNAGGDIFITDYNAAAIVEYSHGATQPLTVLSDAGSYPVACDVDRSTGDLAVANSNGPRGYGDVAIYERAETASLPHVLYDVPDVYVAFGCAYDASGNLFVVGEDTRLSFSLVELPRGSTTFTRITLNKRVKKPYGIAAIVWDGRYVGLGNVDTSTLFRVRVSGTTGAVVGSTRLTDGDHVDQFFIEGSGRNRVLVGTDYEGVNVKFWEYPAGGKSIKTIPGIDEPVGAVVSAARH